MAIDTEIFQSKAKCVFRLFLLLAFFNSAALAGSFSPDNVSTAFRQYLNFEFDSCRTTLHYSEKSPETLYLSHLLTATEIFITDDRAYFKNQKHLESEYLAEIDNSPFNTASRMFLKTEVKIQWSMLKMKYGEEFSAFWNMRQAYHMAKETSEKYPDFIPAYKSVGFLYILLGMVPEKYNWLLSFFGLSGDVDTGREYLIKVWSNAGFYALESGVIMALADAYLLNQPSEGMRRIGLICENTPALLTDYVHCLILMKNASSARAENIISKAEKNYPQPFRLPQMYHIAGEINLQKGEINKAIDSYGKFILHQKGKGLIKDAYFKTGICYLIQGEEELSANYLESARISGWSENEADQYAESQLRSGHISDKDLYRLRYATDGGYYDLARDIQSTINWRELQGQDLCEYYYRTARLMQNSGVIDGAILFYKKTIESQGEMNWYYAPNSALLLGLIYISEIRPANAKASLELVFTYKKNYPYQKSIRQKAKTALKNLDK